MQDKFNKVCIVTCSDTYEKIRADFVYNYFINSGASVVVHTTDFLHIEKCKRTDKKENYIFHETKPYKKNLSVARITSHMKLAKDVFDAIEDEDFELLWVILPPNSSAKEAKRYIAKHPKTKLVFDIMDLWPETMPIAGLEWLAPIKYWAALRNNNLALADLVVTECRLFKERLKPEIQPKVRIMLIGRSCQEIDFDLKLPEDRINLCYLGSMNNIIDIETLTKLIASLNENVPVTLHLVGDGEKRDEVIESLNTTGANIIFHGKIYDRREKQLIFDSCHFGLNIMKSTVVVGLTMKSIDYFEYGIPVINNIVGDTWNFIEEEKLGINLEGSYIEKILKSSNDYGYRNRARDFFVNRLSEEAVSICMDDIIEEL